MSLILFCNVGNRDVQLDGQDVSPPRKEGKRLFKKLETVQDRLTFPIVTAVMEEVLKLGDHFIDHLIFIGTDQENKKYRKGDTLYFAEILAALIPQRYADKVGQPHILTVGKTRNPSLYDEAWKEFERILRPFAGEKEATCIVSPMGGIPACNTALILQGIHLYGERCHIYYQPPNEDVIPLAIGNQVLGLLRQNTFNEALSRFDFTTAAGLYAANDNREKAVQALLDYGAARLRFDFESAAAHLSTAVMASDGATRSRLQQIKQDIERLMNGNEIARIAELFYNARIAWDNGRYNEFLSRVVRFQTAVLQLQVPTLFEDQPLTLEETDLRSLPIRRGLRTLLLLQLKSNSADLRTAGKLTADPTFRPSLKTHLDKHFSLSELKTLCFSLGIDFDNIAGEEKGSKIENIILFMDRRDRLPELVQAASQQRPTVEWFQQPTAVAQNRAVLAGALARLDSLVELQNDSIVGFGYQCISQKVINDAYPAPIDNEPLSPAADMADICLALGIHLTNPFLDVCEIIDKELQHAGT